VKLDLLSPRGILHRQLLWIGDTSPLRNEAIAAALEAFEVVTAASVQAALLALSRDAFGAAVISSASAEDCAGEEIDKLQRSNPGLPVIIQCHNGTIDDVIRLTRRGAFYVLLGDIDPERLRVAADSAIEKSRPNFHPDLERLPWRKYLIGQSAAMLQIYEVIQLIAPKRVTVLIGGETGTGKEVIAKAIHGASNRSALPMVSVNCTALPATLIETELFGHAKGAFTGAHANRVGRFEQAHKSTIFLDEIGDLPLEAQAKLLRVLQDHEFVRVVAASNVDLEQAARERRFREDLFYRLNVVPIHIPPLRERREDIPLLLDHFLEKISRAEDAPPKQISPDAVEYLTSLAWPGNVRQLEHAVQMAFALSGDRLLLVPSDFATRSMKPPEPQPTEPRPLVTVSNDGVDFDEAVNSFERSLLNQALAVSGGNKARAADLLKIKRTTLLAKMKSLEQPVS
jgi:two-component system response regulator AtoC